jgi:hypothetical protein
MSSSIAMLTVRPGIESYALMITKSEQSIAKVFLSIFNNNSYLTQARFPID